MGKVKEATEKKEGWLNIKLKNRICQSDSEYSK